MRDPGQCADLVVLLDRDDRPARGLQPGGEDRLAFGDPATSPGNHAPGARFDDAVLGDGARLLAELARRDLAAG